MRKEGLPTKAWHTVLKSKSTKEKAGTTPGLVANLRDPLQYPTIVARRQRRPRTNLSRKANNTKLRVLLLSREMFSKGVKGKQFVDFRIPGDRNHLVECFLNIKVNDLNQMSQTLHRAKCTSLCGFL